MINKEKLVEVGKEKKYRFIEDNKVIQKSADFTSPQQRGEHTDKALDFYKNLTTEQKEQFHKEMERKKIRDNYLKYLQYVYPNFIATKFHTLLANICQSVVEKVEKGQMVRLLLSVPPQFGKTTVITKTLPSWFVGRNKGLWAILSAYNADIAEEFSDNNRQLIKNFGKELFGIETNSSQDNKTLFQTHKTEKKKTQTLIVA